MKKNILLLILLIVVTTNVFACTCPQIKGLNGRFAGITTVDSLMQNTLLVSVTSKSDSGIIVEVLLDYHNKVDFKFLFIKNGHPSVNCLHSTNHFQIEEVYIISPVSIDLENKSTALPICWESYVNLSMNPIKAHITNQKNDSTQTWTIPQIENLLEIEIPLNTKSSN